MSSWIKAEYRFAHHAARFLITERESFGEICDILKDKPQTLELWLRRLLLLRRPSLATASIECMRFNQSMQMWEVTIVHPSLPKVLPGDVLQTFRLDKCADFEVTKVDESATSLWDDEAIKSAMNADKAIVVKE